MWRECLRQKHHIYENCPGRGKNFAKRKYHSKFTMQESKMARFVYFLLLIELILITPSYQNPRHGFAPEILHANNELAQPTILEPEALGAFVHGTRTKRDVKSSEATSKSSSASSIPENSANKISSVSVNGRTNATSQTINNITTMVSNLRLLSFYLDLCS